MSVALNVDDRSWEVGSSRFFHAFFSTIAVRLEDGRWGSRFPRLMRDLYSGSLPGEAAAEALRELDEVQRGLFALPPSDVVWDAENRDANPPWGDRIAPTVTNLGNYWWTSDGRELFGVLREAFVAARERGEPVVVG